MDNATLLYQIPILLISISLTIAIIWVAIKSWRVDTNADPGPSIDDIKRSKEIVEYSERLMEYLYKYISDIATVKFREFIDSKKDLESLTRNQLEKLITEVSTIAFNNFKIDEIDEDSIIYKRDFIEEQIPLISAHVIKKLFESEFK